MSVIKICFYGPESTGKTTMAVRMAELFNVTFVPEVAREVVDTNDFTIYEIIEIGKRQTERVINMEKAAHALLICDTDLITTQIYSRHYLGIVPDILFEFEKRISYDRYFLFDVDVPWVADGMRDLNDKRGEMFDLFRNELERRNIQYDLVKGDYATREAFLVSEIKKLCATKRDLHGNP